MQHHRWVEKEAAGVVAAIIAYNYPNQLALAKLPPALAAGCTVVLKGAPGHPAGDAGARRADRQPHRHPARCGERAQLVRTPEVGAVLTTSPDVDVVTFTGSTATGRKIMAAASDTLKKRLPRTGRQVGDDRPRRRRLPDGGTVRGVFDGQLACGPGLRAHVAAAGAEQAPRRDRRTWSHRTSRLVRLRRSGRPEDLHGTADQRAPARQGRRHGPAGRRRPARRW